MTNQQLLDFIKSQLAQGLTKEKISSELLANGWNTQDIEGGFKAVVPVSNLSEIPIPPIQSSISIPSTYSNALSATKLVTHTGKKVFLIVLILFLLAGGASAYYFRNNLMNLPIVKSLIETKQVTPIIPITPIQTTTDTTSVTQPDNLKIDPSLSIYNDPNGLFSFSYQKDERIILKENQAIALAIDRGNKPIAIIIVVTDTNNTKLNLQTDITKFTKSSFGNVDGYPSDKYAAVIKDKTSSNNIYESIYVINLGSYNNTKLSILFDSVVNINDQEIMDQIEKNVKSILINKDNIPSVAKALLAKISDTSTKKTLQDEMVQAELYYEKNNAYTGFCKSNEYNGVEGITKLTNLYCEDSSNTYVISASISDGYWCVDYKGNKTNIPSNAGGACGK